MSLPLWGQLEKDQDDSETIEEAIDRIVDEHNSDSEAHQSDGQAVKNHREESIIDHPPFSIVEDKVKSGELDLRWFNRERIIVFSNMGESGGWDSFSTGSGAVVFTITETEIRAADSADDLAAVAANAGRVERIKWGADWIWQSTLAITDDSDILATFGFCNSAGFTGDSDGVWFRFEDGQMYAGHSVDFGTESKTSVDTPSIGFDEMHTYRIHYVNSEDKLYYYIDGAEVHTETNPPKNTKNTTISSWEVKTKNGDTKKLWVSDVKISVSR